MVILKQRMVRPFLGDGRSVLPVLVLDWELEVPVGRGLRYPTGACGRAAFPPRSVRLTCHVGCARTVLVRASCAAGRRIRRARVGLPGPVRWPQERKRTWTC